MVVTADFVFAGRSFNQSHYALHVGRYHQNGGEFVGGGDLTIDGVADVIAGTLMTGDSMAAASLAIEYPGVVTMAKSSKLRLTGDGEPLTGIGFLDVTTNGSNSISSTSCRAKHRR